MKKLNDAQIKTQGIDLLNSGLGAAYAYKFIMMIRKAPLDSIVLSCKAFAGKTVKDIFAMTNKKWKAKYKKKD